MYRIFSSKNAIQIFYIKFIMISTLFTHDFITEKIERFTKTLLSQKCFFFYNEYFNYKTHNIYTTYI